MSALGQKQTCAPQNVMSALPQKRTFGNAVQNRNTIKSSQRGRRNFELVRWSARQIIAMTVTSEVTTAWCCGFVAH
jgi:hypothetical protein